MQISKVWLVNRTISRLSNAQSSTGLRPTFPQSERKKMEGMGEDFRPPWVYVGTRLISFVVIPAVGLYSVFLYDFGTQNHVFTPVRRWTANAFSSFFTLSSEEKKLLQQEQDVGQGYTKP
ncbi:hypothetical protein CPB83DRAFT_889464 [Crepidotus variabilis]|uniref:Transmembrane protein n=1 Tax=Crepidotus variabilis TaxID=179855 RepID=A0A9P6JVG3_9AGAR|nr:hypothetical protein CPB83DRAFT_889464 [Crepidotus variabilis]